MAVTRVNAQAIQQAAQDWAKAQNLDLGSLSEPQQKEAIQEVSKSTGLNAAEVLDVLMAQWTTINEDRGRALGQKGGGGAYLGASEQRSLQGSAMGYMIQNKLDAKSVGTFGPESLNFATGKEVISSAQKFIIPIPKLADGGKPFINPDTGGPITDWQGKAVEGKGFIFKNAKDDAWQAVSGDGSGVIIANQVTEEQAEKIERMIGDPSKMSYDKLAKVMDYLHNDLGVTDTYNSDRAFIAKKMNAVEQLSTGVEAFGLHRRDDRDICHAVYVEGSGEFQGPAATPQQFTDGAVLLKQGDDVRLIQPDIFLETYNGKDGSLLELDDLPVQKPNLDKQ